MAHLCDLSLTKVFNALANVAKTFIELDYIGMAEKTIPLYYLFEEDEINEICRDETEKLKTTLKNAEQYEIFLSAWVDSIKYYHNITLSIVHKTYADRRAERWNQLLSPV